MSIISRRWVGTAGFAVLAASIGALPASAGTPGGHATSGSGRSESLYSSTVRLKSNSGKELGLVISAFRPLSSGQGPASVTVEVFTSTRPAVHEGLQTPADVGETAYWQFDAKALSTSGKTFRLDTGTALGKYGSLNLTFTSTKTTPARCSSGSAETYTGRLSGRLDFSTRSTWGTLKRRSYIFSKGSTVTRDDNCAYKYSPPPASRCFAYTSWGGPGVSGRFAGNQVPGKRPLISASRSVKLSSPKGAYRYDTLTAFAKSQTTSGSATSPTLHVAAAGGAIAGSATISNTSGGGSTPVGACTAGSKHYHQYIAAYSGNWSSPGSSNLVAHFTVGGVSRAPTSGTAGLEVASYH